MMLDNTGDIAEDHVWLCMYGYDARTFACVLRGVYDLGFPDDWLNTDY